MMHQVPYRIQVEKAIKSGDDALIQSTVTQAMQEIGDNLQAILQGYHFLDIPYAIAALELAVESLRGTMSPNDQQLATDLKKLVVCTTISLNCAELQKQAQEMADEG